MDEDPVDRMVAYINYVLRQHENRSWIVKAIPGYQRGAVPTSAVMVANYVTSRCGPHQWLEQVEELLKRKGMWARVAKEMIEGALQRYVPPGQ